MLLSVIVPIGPSEAATGRLVADLLLLPNDCEVIFVACDEAAVERHRSAIADSLTKIPVRWLVARAGRASQQNAGAEVAHGRFLWFVHWDSGFDYLLLHTLLNALRQRPTALHYCRLQFLNDGRGPMKLNSWGANWRSRWLGVPFGDQGFALSASLFRQLGGFDEQANYGEDHLLVWTAHHRRVPLCCCRQPLLTSARKYRHHGWGKLTLRYQWLWIKQALPQVLTLLRLRCLGNRAGG